MTNIKLSEIQSINELGNNNIVVCTEKELSKISLDKFIWVGTEEQYLLLDEISPNIFYCIEEELYDTNEQE